MKQAITLIVILVAGAALTFWFVSNNSDDSDTTTDTNNNNTSTTNSDSTTTGADYVDGTYSADVTYDAPEGHVDDLGVTITIADDVITSVSIQEGATNPKSEDYQQRFINAIDGDVVGKDVDSVSLSRTGGASLTSDAFNDALDEIKLDAAI